MADPRREPDRRRARTAATTAPAGGGLRLAVATGLIVLAAAALRLAAARDGLWLDEVWSLVIAREAASAWALLARLHHDNNHVLNSWLLRAMAPATSPWLLRLPAILSGIFAVVVAGRLALRRGGREALVASSFSATSFLLVQYSSEARGYSLAVLFGLLAWLALRRVLETGSRLDVAVFWACCVLGMLSHLTFVGLLAGLLAWSAGAWWPRGWKVALREGARCHAVPLAATAGILAMTLPDLVIGGGPPKPAWQVALTTLSLIGGGPREGALAWAVAALVAGAVLAAIEWLRRQGDPEWLLHAGAIAAVVASVAVAKPGYLAERYFLLPATLALLLLARALAACRSVRRRSLRTAAGLAVVLVVLGNAVHAGRLVQFGRGRPLEALDHVAARHEGRNPSTLMATNDYRAQLLLRWREIAEPDALPIRFLDLEASRGRAADWYLVEEFDEDARPKAVLMLRDGSRYALDRSFEHSGLSGWTWNAYRRVK